MLFIENTLYQSSEEICFLKEHCHNLPIDDSKTFFLEILEQAW